MWAGAGPGASACDMGLCVCTRMSAGLCVTVSVWNRGGVGDSVVSVSLLWGLCACLSSTPLHQARDCGTVLVWAGLGWAGLRSQGGGAAVCVQRLGSELC